MRYSFLAYISILLFQTVQVTGQDGYDITISVKGNQNSFISIAYHLGDKQYIKDTIRTDGAGTAKFSGTPVLDQGLYMVVMPDNSYFEIIIAEDQVFRLSCTAGDFQSTLSFTGSSENTAFLEYQKGWRKLQDRSINNRKSLEANKQNTDSLELLQGKQKEIEKEMIEYLKRISNENKGSLLAALLGAMIPVEIPDFEIPYNIQNPDSLRWIMTYNYNVQHYFDNTDLTDYRLVRTPVLFNKINSFFTTILIQHPDTIIREMERIVTITESEPQVFRFVIVYLFNHFRESQVMGHDAILVELADKYYLSGKTDWVSEEFRKDLQNDVDRLRNNLIGKKGIDLTMETYAGMWRSLYDINKEFIIIYFWEPDCGHCKIATPLLKEVYNRIRSTGVEVFAICTQDDRKKWEDYIVENELEWINGWDPLRQTHFDNYYNVTSTPMVYILNRDKIIIAKKLPVESIESFISNYRKYGM